MEANAWPSRAGLCDDDVHGRAVARADPQQGPCRPLAQNRTRTARENGRHPDPALGEPFVANRVNAAMDPHEPAGGQPVTHRRFADRFREQLPKSHHPVLGVGILAITASIDEFEETVAIAAVTSNSPGIRAWWRPRLYVWRAGCGKTVEEMSRDEPAFFDEPLPFRADAVAALRVEQ